MNLILIRIANIQKQNSLQCFKNLKYNNIKNHSSIYKTYSLENHINI